MNVLLILAQCQETAIRAEDYVRAGQLKNSISTLQQVQPRHLLASARHQRVSSDGRGARTA